VACHRVNKKIRVLTEHAEGKHKISTTVNFISVLFFAACFGVMESHDQTIEVTQRKIIKCKT
jgi:hypothetical protein